MGNIAELFDFGNPASMMYKSIFALNIHLDFSAGRHKHLLGVDLVFEFLICRAGVLADNRSG